MTSNDTYTEPSSAQTVSQRSVVITQGEATVKRTPDQAWLSIATETRETKAEDARRKSAEDMTTVQTAILATGLSADAIKTTGYWLTPEMEWNKGRGTVKGYIARNQIEVRIDNIERLGDVIDAADATRDTTLTISHPRFVLKDQQAVETEALRLAVQAALVRAQVIAASALRGLGEIVRIEEQNLGSTYRAEPFMLRSAMAKASDAVETPITPEDIEVRVQVTLTAELH
jgi:uncharacterized protein